MKKDKAYSYEEKIWKTFYENFNDDNPEHSETAFCNNGLHCVSAIDLHLQNILWVRDIGVECINKTKDTLPELQPYVEEFKLICSNMNKSGANPPDKYEKLTQVLTEAVSKAKEVAMITSDGGTCNLDRCLVFLKRYNEEKTVAAIKAAGIRGYKTKEFSEPCYSLSSPIPAQGYCNTVQAETIRDFLKANGYDASVRYVID